MLKIDGKLFDRNALTGTEVRLIAFLKKSPPDEVFTSANMLQLAGVSPYALRSGGMVNRKNFEGYTAVVGRFRYWGNPKAIQELLRAVGQ